MTAQTADSFLLGGAGKYAPFLEPGASVTGTIVDPPEVRQQTDIRTNDPKFWDNGDPAMQLVVRLQTTLREDTDDDGVRAVYVKGSKKPESRSMHAAVAAAVQTSRAKGLEVGGTLTVTYTGDGVSAGPGLNPPKLYTATYQRPDTAAVSGAFLGTAAGNVNTTTGEVAAPAPAAPAGPPQPNPEQLAALRAAGVDPKAVYPHWHGQG